MFKKIIIKQISVLVLLISNTSFADIKFWTTEVQFFCENGKARGDGKSF